MIINKPYKCSDLTGNGPGEVANTCGCTGSCNDDSACAINAIVDSGNSCRKQSAIWSWNFMKYFDYVLNNFESEFRITSLH